VHVDVRHLLIRRLTVGKKQVHALAAQTGSAQRAGHPVSDAVDLETEVLIELVQEHRMMPGHHQDMTGVDWLVVHECNDLVILIDHALSSWPLMRRQSVQLSSTSIGTTTACQLSTGLSWRFRDSI
jgi:hypothetical protein